RVGSGQGGLEGDVHAGQGLGDRAAGLRLVGDPLEIILVDAVDLRGDGQLDAGDAALADVEADGGRGVHGGGRRAVLGEHVGELHRVAGRVRGAEQLLGGGGALLRLLGAGLPAEV